MMAVSCRVSYFDASVWRWMNSVEVQGPTPHVRGGGGVAAGNLSTPLPSKSKTPPAKGSCGRPKKAL